MRELDNAIASIAWSFGASKTVYMEYCNGIFQIQPQSKILILNFTDRQTFSDIVFNSYVGSLIYTFKSLPESYDGVYVRGDSRSIINSSAYTISTLHFNGDINGQQLILRYRPMVTVADIGLTDGKPLNLIRIYVLSLNQSEQLTLTGNFYLRVTALNITSTGRQYVLNSGTASIALEATLDGVKTVVWLPITSNENGAIVNLEILVANVKVQRVTA
ncbi:hypothetical protein H5T51_00500 [Candidatus Bathyarchaeota archaeon]|nr:hypothetical protein [Candidatus Bathyarchaeota archaeon]